MTDQERFEIEIAPDPALIGAARLFAASVARRFGFSADRVEDVKLAVSEACASLVRGGNGPVRMRITSEARGLDFDVRSEAVGEPGEAADDLPEAMGLEMIRLLFDEAEEPAGPDGSRVLRFVAPLGGPAGATGEPTG